MVVPIYQGKFSKQANAGKMEVSQERLPLSLTLPPVLPEADTISEVFYPCPLLKPGLLKFSLQPL